MFQHNQFISEEYVTGSVTTALPDRGTVQEVITIGHLQERTYDQLGFAVVNEALDLLGNSFGGSFVSSSSQPARNDPADANASSEIVADQSPSSEPARPHEAPVAPDESAGIEVAAGPEEIILDGTRINSASSLAVLKLVSPLEFL